MSSRYLLPVLSLVAFLVLGLVTPLELLYQPASVLTHYGNTPSIDWFFLHDLTANTIHAWRIDPVLDSLIRYATALGLRTPSPEALLALLLFFLFEIALLNGFQPKFGLLLNTLYSACISCTLLLLFGNDLVVFGALLWYPVTLWNLFLLRTAESLGEKISFGVLLCAIGVIIPWATNIFFPLFIAALVPALFLTSPYTDEERGTRTSWAWGILLVLLFCITFMIGLDFPTPSVEHYPASARIVSDIFPYGIVPSHISKLPVHVLFIDRFMVRSLLSTPALLLLALALLSFLVVPSKRDRLSCLGAFCACSMLAIDTVPPEQLSEIGPIRTLCRSLPGWILLSPTHLFFAFSLLIVFHLFFAKKGGGVALYILAAVLISTTAFRPDGTELEWGLIHRPLRKLPFSDFEGRFLPTEDSVESPLSKEGEKVWASLVSPSYPLFWRFGLSLLDQESLPGPKDDFNRLRGLKMNCLTSSGTLIPNCRKFRDQIRTNRWSQKKGKQEGNEWLSIRFESPLTLLGVKLDPGKFHSDFPRGVKVLGAEACEDFLRVEDISRTKLLFTEEPWVGPLYFHNELFPYIGSPADVALSFGEERYVQCLLILQTGMSSDHDWSVSEIGFRRALNPPSYPSPQ